MSKRWGAGRALVVGALVMATGACSTSGPSTTAATVDCGGTATKAYATHDGVDPTLNSLDLFLPAADEAGRCDHRPLVVWVHGGAWHEGDKTDNITDKAVLFTDAGYVFASVNYRLTDGDADPPTPRHPVHDQDAADAVAWLISHADEFGIDLRRVAALGHSAGGGIVAAITTDDTYLGAHDLPLDAVRCAGSIDGEGYDIAVGAQHPDPRVHEPYLDAFGDDPEVWHSASPLAHVARGKGIPDYFVVARGPDGRLDLHRRFVEALDGAGVPTTVIDAQQLDHGQVSTDIGAPGDTVVTPALTAFLDGCFAGR